MKSQDCLTDDVFWSGLLAEMRNGGVVPVVGPRLLVEPDGSTPMMARIAEAVLMEFGLDVTPGSLPPFRELNEVCTRLKQRVPSVDLGDVYFKVHDLLEAAARAGDAALPVPIKQLAEITDFKLLVTLTPDDCLLRGLRKHRPVHQIVHSLVTLPEQDLVASPTDLIWTDLPADWSKHRDTANLLHLFGKTLGETFALHDEDILEYAHSLLTNDKQKPTLFLTELRNRGLLLIGCDFSDWLSRLFLRLTAKDRLASNNNKRKWVVDALDPEESLTCFLSTHSMRTVLQSSLSPSQFVGELHRRWMQAHSGEAAAAKPAQSAHLPAPIFFVSYSRSADEARARAFVDRLRLLGAKDSEIWFDAHTIKPGNQFLDHMSNGINRCSYFLPLLSKAADAVDEGLVFTEWREANRRRERMGRDYVLPVVVDDEFEPRRYGSELVLEWRNKIDFGFAPGGIPDQRLEAQLKSLLDSARKDVLKRSAL